MLIVNKNGTIIKKFKAISPRNKTIKEEFLQNLIFQEPELLLTQDIDTDYGRLIPLRREFSVSSGSIDVLYCTSGGRLCIVETKLWRNPEAHRTVVAQILDYATDLSNLSFQEFCEGITQERGTSAIQSFFKIIKKYIRDIDEINFQFNIQESLSTGRFLLLIVGDKIYPEVALLTESIQSAPHLEFKLALAELTFYQANSGYLVAPRIVRQTTEVTRAVVKIRYEQEKPEVDVTAFEESEQPPRGKTNLREFLSQMPEGFEDIFNSIIQGWIESRFMISWGTVGFTIRVREARKYKSILESYPGNISIFTDSWAKKKDLPLEICREFQERVRHIEEANRLIMEDRVYLYYKRISIEEYSLLMSELDKTVREIIEHYSTIE